MTHLEVMKSGKLVEKKALAYGNELWMNSRQRLSLKLNWKAFQL